MLFRSKKPNKIIYFAQILLAFVAVAYAAPEAEAEAEADPALLYAASPFYANYYGYAGYPYAYAGYYGLGLKSAPCVNAANQPVPCAAFNGYAKREAEAEADPALLYAGYYGHPYAYSSYYGYPYAYAGYPYAYYGLGLKSAPCVNALNQPVPCA